MKRAQHSRRTLARLLLPILVAGVFGSSAALADVVYTIHPDTTNPAQGSNGNAFDVLATNTGPSSLGIGAFSFGVYTTDTDITFTEANVSTIVSSYIFEGNSFVEITLNSTVISITSGGQTLTANDLTNDFAAVTVAPGATVDLGKVLFDVAPDAVMQTFTVSFTGDPGAGNLDNNLSDQFFTAINVDAFQSGDFPIGPSVPEPSPAVLVLFGLAGLWMLSRLLRSRRACVRAPHA